MFGGDDCSVLVNCDPEANGLSSRDLKLRVREMVSEFAGVPYQELVLSWRLGGPPLAPTIYVRRGSRVYMRRAAVSLPPPEPYVGPPADRHRPEGDSSAPGVPDSGRQRAHGEDASSVLRRALICRREARGRQSLRDDKKTTKQAKGGGKAGARES